MWRIRSFTITDKEITFSIHYTGDRRFISCTFKIHTLLTNKEVRIAVRQFVLGQ